MRDTSKESVQWIPVNTPGNSNARVLKRKSTAKDDDESSDEEVYIVEVCSTNKT